MKCFKSIFSITIHNFRKWTYDCRIWIIALILIVLVHSYSRGISTFCDYVNMKSSPWIFPFLYMQYYTKLLFFFPLILLFSNAPFIDANQLYIIVRSGRIKWCIGQICYIIVASALYFIYIILLTIIVNIGTIDFTNDWGKVLNTLANTDACIKFNIQFSPDRNVINTFSPLQATWFTFLHSWISGVILGMLIFLFNLINKYGAGTFISSSILIFSAIASKQVELIKFSPVSWSTLNFIHLQPYDNLPTYVNITTIYLILLSFFMVLILFISRNYNINKYYDR